MESNQYFIIWNNGFKYLKEILSIIRDHPSLKITRIFKKVIQLNNFIKHIYKLDKSSYQHIEAKSKYLNSIKPEIFIIFVKDLNTIYKTKPNSNQAYSYNERFIKWHIRLLYNPRTDNRKSLDITNDLIDKVSIQQNWPDYITHNHVIHSSDIEEETKLIIDYFGLEEDVFDLTGNKYFNYKKEIKEINTNKLLVNTTYGDDLDVKTTPHYKYLLGDIEQYDEYILETLGIIITFDNLSGAYDKLIKKFDYGKIIQDEPNYIICRYNEKLKKYTVLDGVHRLSILVFNKVNPIKIYVLK
jgi:hypothetical protein